jgi:hypothetical protein
MQHRSTDFGQPTPIAGRLKTWQDTCRNQAEDKCIFI